MREDYVEVKLSEAKNSGQAGNTGSERERNPSPKDRLKRTNGIVFVGTLMDKEQHWPGIAPECGSKKGYPAEIFS